MGRIPGGWLALTITVGAASAAAQGGELPPPSTPPPGGWRLVHGAVPGCGGWVPASWWVCTPSHTHRDGGTAGPVDLTPMDVSGLQPGDAERLFWRGYRSYWQRNYGEAWRQLDAAVRLSPKDARAWYYQALTERALGRTEDAAKSRARGVEAEQESPRSEQIGLVLERVQGAPRRWLNEGKSLVRP